jgi:hypothetical protein
MGIIWRLEAQSWPDLPASLQKQYAALVDSYGGVCVKDGTGEFRRYRAAEICARTLEYRLGIHTEPRLAVAPREPQGA